MKLKKLSAILLLAFSFVLLITINNLYVKADTYTARYGFKSYTFPKKYRGKWVNRGDTWVIGKRTIYTYYEPDKEYLTKKQKTMKAYTGSLRYSPTEANTDKAKFIIVKKHKNGWLYVYWDRDIAWCFKSQGKYLLGKTVPSRTGITSRYHKK